MSEISKSSRSAGGSAVPPIHLDSPPRTLAPNDHEEEQANARKSPDLDQSEGPHYRFLSPEEWTILARAVGGISDPEQHAPVHPKSRLWPTKGLPEGLYRDIIHRRTVSFYSYHFASTIRWVLLILQLILGASLTALGSMSYKDGTPITVLGAANTVIAGLLALLHNSGLPDRYRYDKAEFEQVEDHIRELLTTGLVRADKSVNDVLAECYDMYHHAKTTVEANMPAAYIPSQEVPVGKPVVPTVARDKGAGTSSKPHKALPEEKGQGPAVKTSE
ncbi:hypothetical protein NW762_001620 [Fusarium torreyae]|uniref:SMODS and SLOG-associating 2TM effector domain-containing protein n=1 Tax=Fusarium torreyae TaxID=1237075 RepID=A0A9W8SDN1_9HYPO|nr:hypothetical protein NW762_001620 [Fusarium torreyae]